MTEKITDIINEMREKKPLVCCMTNYVVMEWTANVLLAAGALPVMVMAGEEAEEMVRKSDSLLINIGTLTEDSVKCALIGGKCAKQNNIPIVFDPVGAGASEYRLEKSFEIIEKTQPDIIKGNPGEISALLGLENRMKGVESSFAEYTGDRLAFMAGKKFGCVCAVTGKYDYASDGKDVFVLKNGTNLLNKIVGTGCALGALCCGFAYRSVLGVLSALALMSISGELAEKKSQGRLGAFREELISSFFDFDTEYAKKHLCIEKITLF